MTFFVWMVHWIQIFGFSRQFPNISDFKVFTHSRPVRFTSCALQSQIYLPTWQIMVNKKHIFPIIVVCHGFREDIIVICLMCYLLTVTWEVIYGFSLTNVLNLTILVIICPSVLMTELNNGNIARIS